MKKKEQPSSLQTRVNLRLLEIFVAVAEQGTMSAAAARLELSQAAVSQAVLSLEEALGVDLFDRSVRPPALTLFGITALRYANDILAKVGELSATMRTSASGHVPLLRIGMLDSFTSTAGAPMLEHLKDVATEWTVTSGFRATRLQALVERKSDVIITSEESSVPDSVQTFPLLREEFMLAVPMRFKGDRGNLKKLAAELDFIRYGRDSHMGGAIDQYLVRAGIRPSARYQFDTTDAVLRMVASGFGWTIMTPLIFLKSKVLPKTVALLPLPGKPIRRTIIVAMRGEEARILLPRLRAAASIALREVVMPQIAEILPKDASQFKVLAEVPRGSGN